MVDVRIVDVIAKINFVLWLHWRHNMVDTIPDFGDFLIFYCVEMYLENLEHTT